MQDDSSLSNGSASKSKLQRAQSTMSGSFRMAASVLSPNSSISKKTYNLTAPKLTLKDPKDYKKQLECQICFTVFGKFGQHHCRTCANAVCSSCSYSTINKERACDKCAYHYSDMQRQKFKLDTIRNLTYLCVQCLGNKYRAEQQLKTLQNQIPKQQERMQERRATEEKVKKQNERLEQIAQARRKMEAEIQKIKNS